MNFHFTEDKHQHWSHIYKLLHDLASAPLLHAFLSPSLSAYSIIFLSTWNTSKFFPLAWLSTGYFSILGSLFPHFIKLWVYEKQPPR